MAGLAEPGRGAGVLARLAATIESRKRAAIESRNGAAAESLTGAADGSYVASLLAKGDNAILKKIGEEATETVMAAKDGDKIALVGEIADLWFHCLVLLASRDLSPDDVLAELERREGRSGLDEKAQRK